MPHVPQDDISKELMAEALRPRRLFLVLAGVMAGLAFAAFLYEEELIARSGDIAFAFLLGMLILMSVFFVFCYREPRLGNRMLGFSGVISGNKAEEAGAHFTYSGGFKTETGAADKARNTRRKTARHLRKKTAAATREMQSSAESKGPQEKPGS